MRKTELLKRIRRMAADAGVQCEFVRQGARHELWRVGSRQFSIPRHNEIDEHLAREIMRQAGEGTKSVER